MKKEKLNISYTVYPDKEYSFNEISKNIKLELKYNIDQKLTLAVLEGFIDAHIDNLDSKEFDEKQELAIIAVLNRLKTTLMERYGAD